MPVPPELPETARPGPILHLAAIGAHPSETRNVIAALCPAIQLVP